MKRYEIKLDIKKLKNFIVCRNKWLNILFWKVKLISFPTEDTVFGKIQYKNKKYDLLNQPIGKAQSDKINQYKKDNDCGISSAPWSVNKFDWIIKDDKLYLSSIKCKLCKNKENLINNIFNTNELFASWVNKDIKLLVSKKELGNNKQGRMMIEREVLILEFENGSLKKSRLETEQYCLLNLKKYLDS